MAETPPKRRAKPARGDPGVLGTLPATRPERIGRPRQRAEASPARQAGPEAAGAPAADGRRARKPRAADGEAAVARPGPKAVRPAAPPLRAARAGEPPPKPIAAPTGTELVATSIRAAGELAQIGITLGGRMLKRTIDRIPRP